MTTADVLQTFADSVLAQQECIARGDAKKGNRHAKAYITAARELLGRGESGIDSFADLMASHNLANILFAVCRFPLAPSRAILRADGISSA